MTFCTAMGGEVTRLSWRKCQKVAPSWSGLRGAPLGVVLPSAARPATASWNSLVCSAGRSSTTAWISAGPGFPSEWRTPAGTTIVSPALAMSSSPSRVKRASPEVMMKRSSWRGWMCSVISPPGMLRQLKRTSCPSLSSATAVNSIHSLVAGLKKGRKPVIVLSAGRAVVGLADQVLGDRGLLAVLRDDGPRRQVGQGAGAAGDDGHDRHDHPDQGHVPAEVLGGSGADPGHHLALPAACQHLGAVCAVHVSLPFRWSGVNRSPSAAGPGCLL